MNRRPSSTRVIAAAAVIVAFLTGGVVGINDGGGARIQEGVAALGLFAEIFRLLRPGGRMQIADIVVEREVPESAKKEPHLWTG